MLENAENNRLVGKWKSDPDDQETISEYGDVWLDFSPNGGLTYTVHAQGKRQIMLLTYRVEGNVLITDQPSDPKEERTRFEIRADGKLVLLYDRPSRYVRADEIPSSSAFPAVNPN
jgi:hypothetical protein